jgi:hypothetical protein
MNQEWTWKIVGGLAGVGAGWVARTALQTGWRQLRGEAPPENPASPSTTWPDALLWAAGSGIALAVARLVAQRGAAGAWKSATGSYPDAVVASGKAA